MIKVSIIIPIYNVEQYIERCIMSVINQTYPYVEIILVDDKTPDNSIQIARNIILSSCCEYDVLFITHDINKGLSAARNTGIKNATGDYVYFLDSDDEISLDCIKLLVDMIGECDFAIGDYVPINAIKKYQTLNLPNATLLKGSDILYSYLNEGWYAMAWNKLLKRNFVIDNCLFFAEGLLHEDMLWGFQLAVKAKSFIVVAFPTYNYYLREGSITSGSIDKRINSLVKICDNIIQFAFDNNVIQIKGVVHLIDSLVAANYYLLSFSGMSYKTCFYYYNEIKKNQLKYKELWCKKGVRQFLRDIHCYFPGFIGYNILLFLAFILKRYKLSLIR